MESNSVMRLGERSSGNCSLRTKQLRGLQSALPSASTALCKPLQWGQCVHSDNVGHCALRFTFPSHVEPLLRLPAPIPAKNWGKSCSIFYSSFWAAYLSKCLCYAGFPPRPYRGFPSARKHSPSLAALVPDFGSGEYWAPLFSHLGSFASFCHCKHATSLYIIRFFPSSCFQNFVPLICRIGPVYAWLEAAQSWIPSYIKSAIVIEFLELPASANC